MASPPDMAMVAPDLATGGGGTGGTGGGGDNGGGGSGGGGTGTGGNGNNGGSSGCSMGGVAPTGAWIFSVVFAGILGSRRRRPPRS